MSAKNCVTHHCCDCIQEKLDRLQELLKSLEFIANEDEKIDRDNFDKIDYWRHLDGLSKLSAQQALKKWWEGRWCCVCCKFKSWKDLKVHHFIPDNAFEGGVISYICGECIAEWETQ